MEYHWLPEFYWNAYRNYVISESPSGSIPQPLLTHTRGPGMGYDIEIRLYMCPPSFGRLCGDIKAKWPDVRCKYIAPRDRIHKSDGRQSLTDGRRSVILSAKRTLGDYLTVRHTQTLIRPIRHSTLQCWKRSALPYMDRIIRTLNKLNSALETVLSVRKDKV